MESLLHMHKSAIEANISYFQALRNKAVEQALDARAQELKWVHVLAMKENPDSALKDLLSST